MRHAGDALYGRRGFHANQLEYSVRPSLQVHRHGRCDCRSHRRCNVVGLVARHDSAHRRCRVHGLGQRHTAIVLSVRNEGHGLSAVARRLISPLTRTILFLFIFFYLLLVPVTYLHGRCFLSPSRAAPYPADMPFSARSGPRSSWHSDVPETARKLMG